MSYLTYKPTDAEHKLYAPKWVQTLELIGGVLILFGMVYLPMLAGGLIYNFFN